MTQSEFVGMAFTFFLPTVIGVIAVITPIMKLNTTIAKLDSTMEEIKKQNENQDNRINRHSEEIDMLTKLVTEHDVKIKNLEKEHK